MLEGGVHFQTIVNKKCVCGYLITEGFDGSCAFVDIKGDAGLMEKYPEHDASHACSHDDYSVFLPFWHMCCVVVECRVRVRQEGKGRWLLVKRSELMGGVMCERRMMLMQKRVRCVNE